MKIFEWGVTDFSQLYDFLFSHSAVRKVEYEVIRSNVDYCTYTLHIETLTNKQTYVVKEGDYLLHSEHGEIIKFSKEFYYEILQYFLDLIDKEVSAMEVYLCVDCGAAMHEGTCPECYLKAKEVK